MDAAKTRESWVTDAVAHIKDLGPSGTTSEQKLQIAADIDKKTKEQEAELHKTISEMSVSLQSSRSNILAAYATAKTAEKASKVAARREKVTTKEHTDYNKQYKKDEGGIRATYQAALESFMHTDLMPMYDIFVPSARILPPSTFIELVRGGNKYSNRDEFMKLIVDDSPHRNSLHRFIKIYFEDQIRALTTMAP